ncbi:unnamed protein product, partial [marine sediment metagenome]
TLNYKRSKGLFDWDKNSNKGHKAKRSRKKSRSL